MCNEELVDIDSKYIFIYIYESDGIEAPFKRRKITSIFVANFAIIQLVNTLFAFKEMNELPNGCFTVSSNLIKQINDYGHRDGLKTLYADWRCHQIAHVIYTVDNISKIHQQLNEPVVRWKLTAKSKQTFQRANLRRRIHFQQPNIVLDSVMRNSSIQLFTSRPKRFQWAYDAETILTLMDIEISIKNSYASCRFDGFYHVIPHLMLHNSFRSIQCTWKIYLIRICISKHDCNQNIAFKIWFFSAAHW